MTAGARHSHARRPRWSPLATLACGLALVIGLAAAASAIAPASRLPGGPSVQREPVVETTVACPGLRSRTGYTRSTVSAATPPQPGGTGGAVGAGGEATVSTLTTNPANAKHVIHLTRVGQLGAYIGKDGERDSLTGQAKGSLAPGFAVTQTERTVDGPGRGIASTSCLPSATDFWFIGASAGVGQRSILVLTNPERAKAAVDLTLLDRAGVIDAPGGRGVTVAARGRLEIPLDRLAPGAKVLALHVQVRSGRLSTALLETDSRGYTPLGTDWLPAAAAPAHDVVVPGIPGTTLGRSEQVRLDVVNPGGAAAAVRVRLVASDGTFTPVKVDTMSVPSGSVRSVDITSAIRDQAATLTLTSNVPITAGVHVTLSSPGEFGDTAFLAASRPLAQTAVVPDNRARGTLATRLQLAAPGAAATVLVEAFAEGQASITTKVTVPAGSIRVITVEPPKNTTRFGLLVTPLLGSGPVFGVRWLDEQGPRGPLVSALPLRTSPLSVLVPDTVSDPAAGTLAR